MKKIFIGMALLANIAMLCAQEKHKLLVAGNIVTLGTPDGSNYKTIDFPRKNIIIKRGAIPNFNALVGEKLIVARVEKNKKGITEAVLKRKSGLNFFRFFPTVTADISQALENRELIR